MKGYKIRDGRREGIITEHDWKNGKQVISFVNYDKPSDTGWCYREQIIEFQMKDGEEWIPYRRKSN